MIEEFERFVSTPDGDLFMKVWRPPEIKRLEPIVLLHDSLGSVAQWRDFPAKLAERSRRPVAAYDRLGFGHSSVRMELPPLTFIEDEGQTAFPAIFEALGGRRFALFGHSVGGSMAVGIAAEYPEFCEALITESAQAFVEDRTLTGVADAQERFQNPERLEKLRRWHGDRVEWILRAWFDVWTDPQFAAWSLAPTLSRVKCPLLAIHGGRDEFGSIRFPEFIVENARGPTTMLFEPEYGHVPHREDEDRILTVVCDHLEPGRVSSR